MGIAETNQFESCRLVSKMSTQEVEIEVQGPVREDLVRIKFCGNKKSRSRKNNFWFIFR